MAMRYGYFDSEITGYDDENMPIFDRAESSELLCLIFANLISNGVLASPSNCFAVEQSEGMTIKIQPGFGLIKGHFAYDDEVSTLQIAKAPRSYKRIDAVVLRLNNLKRLIEIIVKQGEEAEKPVSPALVQPVSGDYYELCLAEITINAGQTVITTSSISDTRPNSAKCGYITQLIDHLDTSVFYNQLTAFYEEFVKRSDDSYQSFTDQMNAYFQNLQGNGLMQMQNIVDILNAFETKSENDFTDWFENVKSQLSDDVAGHLQNEVNSLTKNVFLRYWGMLDQKTEFLPNGDIEQESDEATALTQFGYDEESHRQITQTLTVKGNNDVYVKTTTFYPKTDSSNKIILEKYTNPIGGGIYSPGDDGGVSALSLPKASPSTVGGVKVGSGLAIADDGTLSVDFDGSSKKIEEIVDDTLQDFSQSEVEQLFSNQG